MTEFPRAPPIQTSTHDMDGMEHPCQEGSTALATVLSTRTGVSGVTPESEPFVTGGGSLSDSAVAGLTGLFAYQVIIGKQRKRACVRV